MGAPPTPPLSITVVVLLTLFAIFAASWWTFWALVDRWTSNRRQVALSDWGRALGFRCRHDPPDFLPEPFDLLSGMEPRVRIALSGESAALLTLETTVPPPPLGAEGPAPERPSAPGDAEIRWHLLVRPASAKWPPTGLRPSGAVHSVLDLFPLSSFPLLGAGERFIIYGSDDIAAAALSASSMRALLPPDVGLLLHGRHLTLDFSARHFDEIEFERMLALADQLALHLTAVEGELSGS